MADDFTPSWSTVVRENASAKTEVDPNHPLRLLYGVDEQARPLFFAICSNRPPIPEVSDDVEVTCGHRSDGTWTLALHLRRPHLFQVFAALCVDLVRQSRGAPTEAVAVAAVLEGLSQWKELLRPPRAGHLSLEELRGLVGELWFGFRWLIRDHTPGEVLAGWRGPLGAPQDLDLGDLLYEVKAVRAGASDVRISSAQQLDPLHRDLRLVVVTVDDVAPGTPNATTLGSLAASVAHDLGASGATRARFADLLAAYPVDLLDPWYEQHAFHVVGLRQYQVTTSFPAVRASELPAGVRDVRYRLDLAVIAPYVLAPPTAESP